MSISLPESIDAIVHIGAGRCSELDSYISSSAKSIILVEPLPFLAEELRKKSESDKRVKIVESAVAKDGSPCRLRQFNFTDVSSLYKVTNLLGLFPGLRVVDEHQVDVCTLVELIDYAEIDPTLPCALVIDAPGAEKDIVEMMLDILRDHTFFEYVRLTCGKGSMYDGASDLGKLTMMLETAGYELTERLGSDPDWPTYEFRLDVNALLVVELKSKFEKSKQKNELLEKENLDLQSQVSALLENLDVARIDINRLFKEKSELTARFNCLERKLETTKKRCSELEFQRNDVKTENKALSKSLESVERKLVRKQDELQEKHEETNDLKKEISEKVHTVTALESERARYLEKFESMEAELNARCSQLIDEIQGLRTNHRVSMKLLAKRDIDLEELRDRYSKKIDSERALQQLIKELHKKLQLASNFYETLRNDHPELITKY